MNTSEKIAMLKNIQNSNDVEASNNFKFVKQDKGLFERTESSKTILTENNKEMLFG